MTRQVVVALSVVATAGLGWAFAQERSERRPDRPRLRQELGLNEDQARQMEKLHSEARKSAIRRQADTRLARLALEEALRAPTVDQKALDARIKELADLHAASLRARVHTRLAMRELLTPEQREKLEDLRPERPRMRERGERPGRPGRGGPGPRPEPGDDEEDDDAPEAVLTRPDGR